MSYPNGFVYIQLQCLAYTVKLNIELSLGDLISRIARQQEMAPPQENDNVFEMGSSHVIHTTSRETGGNAYSETSEASTGGIGANLEPGDVAITAWLAYNGQDI